MEYEKEVYKDLRKIEEAWGVKAYQDIFDVLYKMEMRIADLVKSRENWRTKYFKLKRGEDLK